MPAPNKIENPKGKANEYVKEFAARSSSENFDPETLRELDARKTERRKIIEEAINTKDEELDSEITIQEINDSFKINKKTAPGADSITYSMLNKTGPYFREAMQIVYNKVWKQKNLAKRWKQ